MVCFGLGKSVNLNACGFGSVSNGNHQGTNWLHRKLFVAKCSHIRLVLSELAQEQGSVSRERIILINVATRQETAAPYPFPLPCPSSWKWPRRGTGQGGEKAWGVALYSGAKRSLKAQCPRLAMLQDLGPWATLLELVDNLRGHWYGNSARARLCCAPVPALRGVRVTQTLQDF